jgi:hypothetical protein
MADVFEAYKALNETLNLGLGVRDLARAEAVFKARMAQESRFPIKGNLHQDWEFISYLAPRQVPLHKEAQQMLQELQSEIESEGC